MRLLVTTRGKVVTKASHDAIVESAGADILISNGQIERIQSSRNSQDGLIINAGGYTHTSVAIHDALKILKSSKSRRRAVLIS